ncbi:MAG: hypothetical protein AAGE52_04620 [Myxococcota bacterium]
MDRLAFVAVGLNFWAVAVFVPGLVAEPRGAGIILPLVAPLVVLGLALLRLTRWVVLAIVPSSLVLSAAVLPEFTLGSPHPPAIRLISALSLLGYGVIAARVVGRPNPEEARAKSLPPSKEDPAAARRHRGRLGMLAIAGTGALLIAVLAPVLGSTAALRRHWGPSAGAAEVLTAVVAGAVATLSLATIVGPATRRRRHPVSMRRRRTRIALLMMVVVLGAFVWMTIQRRLQ